MIFKNIELRKFAAEIVSKGLIFEKGTVSGFSIEVEDPNTESFESYIYYEDEVARDQDFRLMTLLATHLS
jgi:hypothetical protein